MVVGSMDLEPGGHLQEVTIAYETWGTHRGNNAVLVCHALTGDSHCVGWWDRLVGPGRAINPDEHFIIGTNVLGGCQGSTGPSSLAPDGKPFGSRFPLITVGDMVEAQARVLDHLGINRLFLVCGGSMGGMQALEWAARFPERVENVWLTASCAAHNPMQIGFNETARQAIMRDPLWKNGDYGEEPPRDGISVARMVGHLSYLSVDSFESKFGRRLQDKEEFEFHLETEFQVESYLKYQGDKFADRFDANSILILTRALDYFDRRELETLPCRFLLTSYQSDWLYPTAQSEELEIILRRAGTQVSRHEIDLPWGHDCFLLDGDYQSELLVEFLAVR